MNVTGRMALRMFAKGAWNAVRKRPLTISFEVTHACTANCWHCNWGGPIKETRRTPEEYAAICRGLDPVVVNVSGGEPMARGDLDDIVPACVAIGDEDDISLNCCITAWNFRDVPAIVRLAAGWGVSINFSVYTPLRMDDPKGLVRHNGSAAELKEKIAEVVELKRAGYPVYTS